MTAAVPLVGVRMAGAASLLVKCQAILADMRRASKHVRKECGPDLLGVMTECQAMLADMRREIETLRAKRSAQEPEPQPSACECKLEIKNGTEFRDHCGSCLEDEDEEVGS